MKLYVSGSQRTQNCYRIVKDLLSVSDAFLPLGELTINNCKGCRGCKESNDGKCMMEDDMMNVYENIKNFDSIILVSPIYFNQVTGAMKTFIDRLFPFLETELLKGKNIYLILSGSETQEENEEVVQKINEYFVELFDWLKGDFIKTYYFKEDEYLTAQYIDKIYQIKNDIYTIKKEDEENE